MTGFVYVMDAGDRVKIGFSTNPWSRLSQVRGTSRLDCKLAGYAPGTVDDEKEFHVLLRPWRIAGEWFRKEGAVLEVLRLMPPPEPLNRKTDLVSDGREAAALKRAADCVGGQAALAKSIGVSQQIVSWWIRKSGRVAAAHCLSVERAVGGAVSRHELRPDLFPLEAA